ncbi:MAG: oligosaccharide flippase family protein, partial [Desulfobacterales bacterium]|nr:oligosaccharide flippase family protein [Desulfobacterales bacterium]
MLSELKTTLKHSSIYGAANLLKKGAAFFMIPVYTRFLSPSDYGTLELLELVLDVAFLMIGLRMSEAIIRYYHHYSSEEDKVEVVSTAFLFSLMVSLSAVIAFQFFLEPIAGLVFNDPANAGYLKWVFVCLGFQLMFIVPETYLIVKKRSLTYSSLSFASFFLALSLNLFFLVKLKLGIWGMIYSMAITKLSYMVLLFIWVVPHLKLTFSPGKLKELIRFGLPMLPGVLALFTINFSDRFFIQQFCDSHELGIYSLGYKFGMLLVVLMTDPFFRIWNTQRFEIASQDRGSLIIGRYFTYFLG